MNKLAIASVIVIAAAPFAAAPTMALTLTKDLGTTVRYVRTCDEDADPAMLEGEARALETNGAISEDELAADWQVDREYALAEAAQAEGDDEDRAIMAEGWQPAPTEVEDELEPLA